MKSALNSIRTWIQAFIKAHIIDWDPEDAP